MWNGMRIGNIYRCCTCDRSHLQCIPTEVRTILDHYLCGTILCIESGDEWVDSINVKIAEHPNYPYGTIGRIPIHRSYIRCVIVSVDTRILHPSDGAGGPIWWI